MGMRRRKLLALHWLDVDRVGNRVRLPQTKNGDARIVYLNALACRVIDSLARKEEARSTDRVFLETQTDQLGENFLAFLRACRRVTLNEAQPVMLN